MTSGMSMMPRLPANSWDSLELSVSPTEAGLVTPPAPSGWTTCTATARRRGWRIVGLRDGEFMIVTGTGWSLCDTVSLLLFCRTEAA